MDAMETMLAIEEIKQLKARYFRSMDTKDEALYRSVLTEDYTFDAPGIITDPITGYSPYPDPTTDIMRGRDVCANAIFAAIRHPDYSSLHIGHMPEIEIIDPDNARGIWSMTDVIGFPTGDGRKGNFIGYGLPARGWRVEDRFGETGPPPRRLSLRPGLAGQGRSREGPGRERTGLGGILRKRIDRRL